MNAFSAFCCFGDSSACCVPTMIGSRTAATAEGTPPLSNAAITEELRAAALSTVGLAGGEDVSGPEISDFCA